MCSLPVSNFEQNDLQLLSELRQKCLVFKFQMAPRLDFAFLRRFLRVRNYDLDRAHNSVEEYYSCVYDNLDFIRGAVVSQLKPAFEARAVSVLRNRCSGSRVVVARPQLWDPKKVPFKMLQLATLYMGEYISRETQTQDAGVVIVFDLSTTRVCHLRAISIKEYRRTLRVIQTAFPIKIAAIHVVNPHYLAKPLIYIGLALATRKIKQRIAIHATLSDMHLHLDPAILSEEYGGNLEDSAAYDVELIERIVKDNLEYEEFWSIERNINRRSSAA